MQINLKEKIDNYMRVLKISRKPDADEFKQTTKIALIGIGLVGLVGFVFFVLSVLLIPG